MVVLLAQKHTATPKEHTVKIIVVSATGAAPTTKNIDGSLASLQAEVSGCIEPVHTQRDDITVYANEEGLLQNLPLNRNMLIIKTLGISPSLIAGDFIIVGNGEGGEHCDVPTDLLSDIGA